MLDLTLSNPPKAYMAQGVWHKTAGQTLNADGTHSITFPVFNYGFPFNNETEILATLGLSVNNNKDTWTNNSNEKILIRVEAQMLFGEIASPGIDIFFSNNTDNNDLLAEGAVIFDPTHDENLKKTVETETLLEHNKHIRLEIFNQTSSNINIITTDGLGGYWNYIKISRFIYEPDNSKTLEIIEQ